MEVSIDQLLWQGVVHIFDLRLSWQPNSSGCIHLTKN